MRSSIWIISALSTVALAAPSMSVQPEDMPTLSSYFNLLGQKVELQRSLSALPSCDLSKAVMPTLPGLPAPAAGLYLSHVAVGRGIQNYTCSPNNATDIPVAIGAIATLYNASCIAASYPDILALLPNVTLQLSVPATGAVLAPASLDISGHHYFANLTTPFFNLDTQNLQLGEVPCAKNATVKAPAGSPVGQHGTGNGSVAWLQLLARDGATGKLAQVYRVNTAGGSQPATCASMPAAFSVQYAAEYWFWKSI